MSPHLAAALDIYAFSSSSLKTLKPKRAAAAELSFQPQICVREIRLEVQWYERTGSKC
jgi:hypothetical protein